MRRRRLRGALTLGLVAVLAAGGFELWPRPNRITWDFNRIEPGMSRAEVEAILGPPGDYRTGPTTTAAYNRIVLFPSGCLSFGGTVQARVSGGMDQGDWCSTSPGEIWESDAGKAKIVFTDDRVSQVEKSSADKVSQNAAENLLWRAKRQWRKWFPTDDLSRARGD